MGSTVTPKYVVYVYQSTPPGVPIDVERTELTWDVRRHGTPSAESVERFALAYGASLNPGGVNAHLADRDGSIPYPIRVVVRANGASAPLAQWNAPMFMCW